jgi:hypothetical protein
MGSLEVMREPYREREGSHGALGPPLSIEHFNRIAEVADSDLIDSDAAGVGRSLDIWEGVGERGHAQSMSRILWV